jgi:hypothetical protein
MEKKVAQGFNKETILGMVKSKTISINTLLTLAIVTVANTYGVPLTPVEAATIIPVIYGAVNGILRFFTNTSLSEKGIVKNPKKAMEIVENIEENEEAIEKLYTAIAKWKKQKQDSMKFSKVMKM